MKYVYILARRGKPTIGVHTSRQSAFDHLKVCVQDRIRLGMNTAWDNLWPWRSSGDAIRRVLMVDPQDHVPYADEEFIVEKWVLAGKKAVHG